MIFQSQIIKCESIALLKMEGKLHERRYHFYIIAWPTGKLYDCLQVN